MRKLLIALLLAVTGLGAISSTSKAQQTTPAANHTKTDVTPDKRNKKNKPRSVSIQSKKIVSPNKRYNSNKSTAAAPTATGSTPSSNDIKTSMPKPKSN